MLLCRNSFRSLCSATSGSSSSASQQNVRVLTSVCVTRLPVISAQRTQLEEDYMEMLTQVETERSLLNDHELRVRQEEGGQSVVRTADVERRWNVRAAALQQTFAPRKAPAQVQRNKRSLNRSLDRKLVLVTKNNFGHWALPSSALKRGETLRDAAQRILVSLGVAHHTKILGCAPAAVFEYRYPSNAETDGAKGARSFTMKALLTTKPTEPVNTSHLHISDYAWITISELPKLITHSRRYVRHLNSFLYE